MNVFLTLNEDADKFFEDNLWDDDAKKNRQKSWIINSVIIH